MLKPLVPKFRPGLSVQLEDIAEKQVPAKLKPIVGDLTGACFAITYDVTAILLPAISLLVPRGGP